MKYDTPFLCFLISSFASGDLLNHECVAPHLDKKGHYVLSIHSHLWESAKDIFQTDKTANLTVTASTTTVVSSGQPHWLHHANVRSKYHPDVEWITHYITVSFIQYTCNHSRALAIVGYDLNEEHQSFLRSNAAMIPFSLHRNASTLVQYHQMTVCTRRATPDPPRSVFIRLSEHEHLTINGGAKSMIRSWVDHDYCRDMMRQSVHFMTKGNIWHTSLSLQRALIPSACILKSTPESCATNFTRIL